MRDLLDINDEARRHEPQLSQGRTRTDTTFAPMLSKRELGRLGKRQTAFLQFLDGQPEVDVSMLECWKWVAAWTGNAEILARTSKRRKRERWVGYTSASLAAILRSLQARGLVVVVQRDGYNFVRSLVKGQINDA